MQWITRVRRPALTFLLLVLTAVGYSTGYQFQLQDASGSGEDPEKCVVPAYAQQPVSTTEKEALAKMRCHLACIESENLGVIKHIIVSCSIHYPSATEVVSPCIVLPGRRMLLSMVSCGQTQPGTHMRLS